MHERYYRGRRRNQDRIENVPLLELKPNKKPNKVPKPLTKKHPLYMRLKDYGLPVKDPEKLEAARFAMDKVLKRSTGLIWVPGDPALERRTFRDFDGEDFKKAAQEQGLNGKLEPLLWDYRCMGGLVCYQRKDKSFWLWRDGITYADYGDDDDWCEFPGLDFLGNYWTDIFDPYPVIWRTECWQSLQG